MNISEVMSEVFGLLDKHGLIGEGWGFKLGHGKRLMGQCRYRQKLIVISKYLIVMGTDEEIYDTIRHEIAHALTPGAMHGLVWKRKAIELGARPSACAEKASYAVPHKYELWCRYCDRMLAPRHRLTNPAKLIRQYDPRCGVRSIGHLYIKSV